MFEKLRAKTQSADFREKLQSPVTLFIAFFALILIVTLAYVVKKAVESHRDYTPVENLTTAVPDMPAGVRREVEKKVQQMIRKNNPDYSGNYSLINAKIDDALASRPRGEDGNPSKSVSFIVALQNGLEQDYQVIADWSTDPPVVQVLCTTTANSSFPPFDCIGLDSDVDNIKDYTKLNDKMPYHEELATDEDVVIYVHNMMRYGGNGDPYFQVDVQACDDKTLMQAGVNQFKGYIKSLGIDPEKIMLEVRSTCDGSAN